MKIPEYPIKEVEQATQKVEQAPNVPIIDIIRHGYARGFQGEPLRNENLDISSPNFKIDEKHLDLNRQGIDQIRSSINELCNSIDKDNEVVLVLSSPAWRTHSSALVAEEQLKQNGVMVLNPEREIKLFRAIDQMRSHEKKYMSPTPFDDLEEEIAAHKEVQDKVHESEDLGFHRFLRHINNIYKWLSLETLKKLKDKRLRIIVFAHAETTGDFIAEAQIGSYQSRGQILEITPKSQLRVEDEVETDLKLYPTKEKHSAGEGKVLRGFKPKTK